MFQPNNNKLDKSVIETIRSANKSSLHKMAKRVYNNIAACIYCGTVTVLSNRVVSFGCKNCHKVQGIEEAMYNYTHHKESIKIEPDNSSNFPTPAFKTGGSEYSMLRDEMEIRADMASNGKTRDNLGYQKCDKELKKELVKNKCYRGSNKVGI